MNNVSLDIETLGMKPGCVIASIGAVKFDPRTGAVGSDYFYANIDVSDMQSKGFHMDASTVLWWMQQNEAARKSLTTSTAHINVVLDNFALWLPDNAVVWGNGSDFDNAIVAEAYSRLDKKLPWSFRGNRCLRTLRGLAPHVKVTQVGIGHNALDDALYQANLCVALHRELKIG